MLTPLAVEDLKPCPLLPSLQLHVAAVLGPEAEGGVPANGSSSCRCPARSRGSSTLGDEDAVCLTRLEDVIAAHVDLLFPGRDVLATAVFRITRDADVAIEDDDAEDLLQVVEEAVLDRRRRARGAVVNDRADPDPRLREWLTGLARDCVRRRFTRSTGCSTPRPCWQIANRPEFDNLKRPDWPPQPPARPDRPRRPLAGDARTTTSCWCIPTRASIRSSSCSNRPPTIPHVLSIKQTLYRTSGDSPIVRALERAGAKRQGGDRPGRTQGPIRRSPKRQLGPATRGRRLPRHLRHRRIQNPRQGPVDRPTRAARPPALRSPGHGQLQRPHGQTLQRRRPDDVRSRRRHRRGVVLQPPDRLLRSRRLVEAGHRADRNAAATRST